MNNKAQPTRLFILVITIPTLLLLGCEPDIQRQRELQLEDAKTRASACSCGGGGKWSGGGRRWGGNGGNGLRNFGRNFGGGRNWGNGGGWGGGGFGGGNGFGGGGGGGGNGGWMNFWQGLLGGLGNGGGGGLPGGQPPANDYVPPPAAPQNTPTNSAPPPSNPPAVSILYPKPVSEVPSEFKLSADIRHERGIASVEVRVDGNVVGGGTQQPYEYTLKLPPGAHNAELRVFDVTGLSASASVQFAVANPNGSSVGGNKSPSSTTVTSQGAPTTGLSVFGALCELDIDCQSGFCVNDPAISGGPRYCSQPCDQGCPVGSVCLSSNKSVQLCGIALPGSYNGGGANTQVSGNGNLPQTGTTNNDGNRRSISAGCQIGVNADTDGARGLGGALLLMLFLVLRRKSRC